MPWKTERKNRRRTLIILINYVFVVAFVYNVRHDMMQKTWTHLHVVRTETREALSEIFLYLFSGLNMTKVSEDNYDLIFSFLSDRHKKKKESDIVYNNNSTEKESIDTLDNHQGQYLI